MRAFTRSEAIELAFADVNERDRKRRRLRHYFVAADRIKNLPGWSPWWSPPPLECGSCGANDWRHFYDGSRGKWRRACRECRRRRDRRRENR